MPRQIIDNFLYKSKYPLDERSRFVTLAAMRDFNENHVPEGFITFCDEDRKQYQFFSDNDADPVTGKWHELKFSDIPEGAVTGDALVYVDGEWQIMPRYGFKRPGDTVVEHGFTFDAIISGWGKRAEFTSDAVITVGEHYIVSVDGGEDQEAVAVIDMGDAIVLHLDGDITAVRYLAGDNEYQVFGREDLTENTHTIKISEADNYITFDERYLPEIAKATVDVEDINDIPVEDIDRQVFYRMVKDVYDITSDKRGRFELTSEKVTAGYSTTENGIEKEDAVEVTWEEALAAWDTEYYSWFTSVLTVGTVWRYDFDGVQYLEKRTTEPDHPLKVTLHMYAASLEGDKWYTVYDNLAKGGEGGVSSYLALTYKPKINGTELVNDKTSTELGIIVNLTQAEYDNLVLNDQVNPETAYFITDGEKTVTTTNYEELSNKPSIAGITLREGLELNDFNLMTKTEIESKLSSIMAFKGTVDIFSALPAASENERGDVWYVRNDEGDKLRGNYAWTGSEWTDVGGSVDMSPYQLKESEIPLLTTNQTIEGALNELYSNKLAKEPGGLDTSATDVVGAINEINDKASMTKITITGTEGTLSDDDYAKISANPEKCYIARGNEIYHYTCNISGRLMYYTSRPAVSYRNIMEAWVDIQTNKSFVVKFMWDDYSVIARPDTKYLTINTEDLLSDYIAAMPNNSIKEGYAIPPGMSEPGWTTIHKYNNNFVKIIHWTRRAALAYVRSRDNNTTWSPWYQINLFEKDSSKQSVQGNFLEIKNSSYEFNCWGGTIQLNDQRNCMGFMCGVNMNISVTNNPDNIPITRPAAPTGWTYCVQFTSANGTCQVLWDNTNHRMGYTETGCAYFGRHMITCSTRT